MAATVKGLNEVFRGPNDAEDVSGNTTTVTAVWHGPYADLQAAKPAVGSALEGFDSELKVKSARLVKDEGGFGTLTVILEAVAVINTIGIIREHLEVEQMLVERPLLDHPTLTAGGGTMAIDLALWKECPDPDLKRHWYYIDSDNTEQQLTDTEIVWAKKILRGVETWKDYVPVIRRRRTYNGQPTTSLCGTLSTPPISVSGCTSYLMTADNAVEDDSGNFERTEEWTGATGEWDADIYSSSRSVRSKGRGKK